MRIAAFDLGSNSFHLLVVETRRDASFEVLAREREMLRLGDLVARRGEFGKEATARAIAVVRRFKTVADAHRVDEIAALATAAVREAKDGPAFVDRVRRETGVAIEVVDGLREAQLIFSAVRQSVLIDPAPALCADLGGGSLELMVGDRLGLAYAASARVGVGRLTASVPLSDPIKSSERKALYARIDSELKPILEEVAQFKPRMLIGSSGTFTSLVRMAIARRDGFAPDATNQLSVPADALLDLAQVIFSTTRAERSHLAGCETRRVELLPAGAAVLTYLLESTALEELTLSEWALREGIVIDAIGAHDRAELEADPRALRRASVLSLCRRCNWRQPHARKVAELALQLFDELSFLHHLGPDDRELLELGALCHDIGEHISRTGHDRHGAYLIENGGLRGFAPAEIRMLALLVRHHIRGSLGRRGDALGDLDEDDYNRLVQLASLLRLADALDAAHAGVVSNLRVVPSADARTLRLQIAARGDAELELWSLQRKRSLFERRFNRRLDFELLRTGRDEFDFADQAGSGLS